MPRHEDGRLKEEDEHDPEAIEAAVEVPEGALLHEARLSHAVLRGRRREEVLGAVERPAEAVEAMVAPEVLVDVVVVAPGGVGGGAVVAGVDLALDGIVDGGDDAGEEGVLTGDGGESGLPGGVVDVVLEDAVEVHGHVVKDVGEALGDKAEVGGLAPNEEIEGGVEELAAGVGGDTAEAGVRDPDIGFPAEVGAPRGVAVEELLANAAHDGMVEDVDVVRRRLEAHLGVGEEEDEMLPLVADVVALEAEEGAEPVEEVEAVVPPGEGRLTELPDGA